MAIRGWVYVVTNKAMPGLVKVGFTTNDPFLRARDLGGTGVPHDYVVEYDVLVHGPRDVEQKVHRKLSMAREGKEWFRCTTLDAVNAIRHVSKGGVIVESLHVAIEHPCAIEGCGNKATKTTPPGEYMCNSHLRAFGYSR